MCDPCRSDHPLDERLSLSGDYLSVLARSVVLVPQSDSVADVLIQLNRCAGGAGNDTPGGIGYRFENSIHDAIIQMYLRREENTQISFNTHTHTQQNLKFKFLGLQISKKGRVNIPSYLFLRSTHFLVNVLKIVPSKMIN